MTNEVFLKFGFEVLKTFMLFMLLVIALQSFVKLLIVMSRNSSLSSESSSFSSQSSKPTKIQLAPLVTKHEIEASQLRRLTEEKENVK